MMGNKKPKFLLILKILGFVFIGVAITGAVIAFKGFGDFESNKFMLGGIMSSFGSFAGISCLIVGFMPAMSKGMTKTAKYIQEENKENLKDMANTSAEIRGEAITKTVRAIKEGLKSTKFCKHCGAEIDSDSVFCSTCGKEQ